MDPTTLLLAVLVVALVAGALYVRGTPAPQSVAAAVLVVLAAYIFLRYVVAGAA